MNDQDRTAGCPHQELAVGWALHALEPAEESLVAAHLPECPSCSRIAAATEELGATLGLSVPEEIPSARLEQRILGAAGVRPAVLSASASAPVNVPAPPLPQPAVPRGWARWLRSREVAGVAAAILVAATVALGVRVAQLNGELNRAQGEVTAMSQAIQAAADPAAVRVPLVAKDGRAVALVLAKPTRIMVVPTGLPGNRLQDQTYVLWGLRDGTPIALVAFDVVPDAPRPHAVPSSGGTAKFTGYAVSLEPGRSTPAVPTDVVASGQVTS